MLSLPLCIGFGCSGKTRGDDDGAALGKLAQPIWDGTPSSNPSVLFVKVPGAHCSGVVVGACAVATAKHCGAVESVTNLVDTFVSTQTVAHTVEDIEIAYLPTPLNLPVVPLAVHALTPGTTEPFDLFGYGSNANDAGVNVGIGTQRHGVMHLLVSGYNPTDQFVLVPTLPTDRPSCSGDSGGGVFLRAAGAPPALVGLIASGYSLDAGVSNGVCQGSRATIAVDVGNVNAWIMVQIAASESLCLQSGGGSPAPQPPQPPQQGPAPSGPSSPSQPTTPGGPPADAGRRDSGSDGGSDGGDEAGSDGGDGGDEAGAEAGVRDAGPSDAESDVIVQPESASSSSR